MKPLSISSLSPSSLSLAGPSHAWSNEDVFLPNGLPRAAVHEVFLSESETVPYLPSAFIIAGIYKAINSQANPAARRKFTLWIGRDRWPTPYAIPEELRADAYFLDPNTDKKLFWTLDAALRCPAVGAVVTHCERMPFTLSQRFALAARSSGVIGIITRPHKALQTPSASPFRWEVAPYPSANRESPSWLITLHKAKQSLPQNNKWIVDYEDETFSLRIPPVLVSRSSEEFTQERAAGFR